MKINVIGGDPIDTDKMSDLKALMIEKVAGLREDTKKLSRGHFFFVENLDKSLFCDYHVPDENVENFIFRLSEAIFSISGRRYGIFESDGCGKISLLLPAPPIDKTPENI